MTTGTEVVAKVDIGFSSKDDVQAQQINAKEMITKASAINLITVLFIYCTSALIGITEKKAWTMPRRDLPCPSIYTERTVLFLQITGAIAPFTLVTAYIARKEHDCQQNSKAN